MWCFDRRSGKDRRCWDAREEPCKEARKKAVHRSERDRRAGKERRVSWEDHRGKGC